MLGEIKVFFGLFLFIILVSIAHGQETRSFDQLGATLPTPNSYRLASGAPGPNYWQQRADYNMEVLLDESKHLITGSGTITYFNQSPDTLNYLWVQLDQNKRAKGNDFHATYQDGLSPNGTISTNTLATYYEGTDYVGGITINNVEDSDGNALQTVINKTMMRVNLQAPLAPGEKFIFNVRWHYTTYDRQIFDDRGGYEYFPEDDNTIYTIAQWYPRMCVYDDATGWQNKQFYDEGEFALQFGDFNVSITVPADHVVSATGTLTNAQEALTEVQYERFKNAKIPGDKPLLIITQEEAIDNEQEKTADTKTWKFEAQNVRDFAFASSRKFIWDVQAVTIASDTILAMSFYPKEANPLWGDHATKAIVNTLHYYSDKLFPYPYPVAIAVNSADHGMEYPMISFNSGRPESPDHYYSKSKNELIDVVIHEIGHNYFPMIINSDERLYPWMDEGFNTYYEMATKRHYYPDEPYWGDAKSIASYLRFQNFNALPIMCNPERQLFSTITTYGKPSAALTILHDLILGPELFDKAMRTYAENWKFKHPKPADFFRTVEDVTAVDLDWFWRSWFYETTVVDIELYDVKWYRTDVKGSQKVGDSNKSLKMPSNPMALSIRSTQDNEYREFLSRIDDKEVLRGLDKKNIYEISFVNRGGTPSPIVIEINFKNGESELYTIPAEIWRYDNILAKKIFVFHQEIKSVRIDPDELTGDIIPSNNIIPR